MFSVTHSVANKREKEKWSRNVQNIRHKMDHMFLCFTHVAQFLPKHMAAVSLHMDTNIFSLTS